MKLTCITIACLTALSVSAQSERDLALFSTNYSQFNPAATGLFHRLSASASYLNQYPSLNYSPKSYTGSYQQHVECLKGGLGINYSHDPIDYNGSDQRATLQYSYQLNLTNERTLSFGAALGARRIEREEQTSYNYTNSGIVAYTDYAGSGVKPTCNFGMMYKGKKLVLGFSVTQLNDKNFHIVTNIAPQQVWEYPLDRNYYFNAAYMIDMGEKIQIEPQLLYHCAGGFQTLATGLIATYNKCYWLGGQLANRDSFAAMAGVDIAERFRLGYAYSVTVSRLNNGTSGGSHEVVLRYSINYED